jgi:hypothetical protein
VGKKEAAVSHDIGTSEESDSALPNYEATTTSESNIAEIGSYVKGENKKGNTENKRKRWILRRERGLRVSHRTVGHHIRLK